ncbi:MAG: hypothetical protein U0165_12205 [Polyangiaceae bacterium]
MKSKKIAACLGLALSVLSTEASATPSQVVIFLNSIQRVKEGWPQLSLFSFYYGRSDVSVLGIYAGPRWTLGHWGLEMKAGVYGGGVNEGHAIINNQIDYSRKHFSVTSFTDWYPPREVYTYLSVFGIFDPLYVGAVGDVDASWDPDAKFVNYGGGPTIGLGTKAMYLGTSLIFNNTQKRAIRLTVGLTF